MYLCEGDEIVLSYLVLGRGQLADRGQMKRTDSGPLDVWTHKGQLADFGLRQRDTIGLIMYLSEGEEIVLSYPVLGPHRIEEDRERGRGHLADRGQLAVYGFLNNIRVDPMISAYSGTIPNFPGHKCTFESI